MVLAALGALAISVVMNWPLPLHLFDTIPKDLGDPLPQAWQVAWGGHALATQPLDFFQSNQFWPEPDSLAFGDALIGYAPAGLIGDGPDDAVARYNLLFLFVYALCFFGTYLLAREMGLGPGGAVVAGAAFAYAPFRMEQDGHMQVISSGGIPLALALAVRGFRLRRPWPLLGAWAVAAWQVSIGFAIGLPFAYLIALLVAIGAVVWWRRGRPRPERRMAIAGVAGALLFAVAVGVISQPYFRVADRYPEATRTASDVEEFSGPIEALILNSDENWVWGDATLDIFYEINNPAEKTLFPGLVILLLAARRARLVELPQMAQVQPRRGLARDHGPRVRLPGGGRLAVAVPDRLRRTARVGGDPDPGPPRDVRDPGAGPAGRGRGGVDLASALATVAALRPRLRTSTGAASRGGARGCSCSRSWSRAAAFPSTQPAAGPSPRCPTRRPRWLRCPGRSCTCRPSAARTTAATRSGPPTASRTSSTAAPARGPTRSRI